MVASQLGVVATCVVALGIIQWVHYKGHPVYKKVLAVKEAVRKLQHDSKSDRVQVLAGGAAATTARATVEAKDMVDDKVRNSTVCQAASAVFAMASDATSDTLLSSEAVDGMSDIGQRAMQRRVEKETWGLKNNAKSAASGITHPLRGGGSKIYPSTVVEL